MFKYLVLVVIILAGVLFWVQFHSSESPQDINQLEQESDAVDAIE